MAELLQEVLAVLLAAAQMEIQMAILLLAEEALADMETYLAEMVMKLVVVEVEEVQAKTRVWLVAVVHPIGSIKQMLLQQQILSQQ